MRELILMQKGQAWSMFEILGIDVIPSTSFSLKSLTSKRKHFYLYSNNLILWKEMNVKIKEAEHIHLAPRAFLSYDYLSSRIYFLLYVFISDFSTEPLIFH